MSATNENPSEEVCLGGLIGVGGYVCFLVIVTIFKGLGGANR